VLLNLYYICVVVYLHYTLLCSATYNLYYTPYCTGILCEPLLRSRERRRLGCFRKAVRITCIAGCKYTFPTPITN